MGVVQQWNDTDRGTKLNGLKPVPLSLRSAQIPNELLRGRNRASAEHMEKEICIDKVGTDKHNIHPQPCSANPKYQMQSSRENRYANCTRGRTTGTSS